MFTSCGNDDEPDSPEVEKVVKDATFTTSLCVNKTVLDTYDIVGKSADGQELKFSLTPVDIEFVASGGKASIPMYAMSIDAKGNNVPLKASMNITFTLKKGYTVPDKSDMAVTKEAVGTITYTDGTSTRVSNNKFRVFSGGVLGSKINEYTEKLNKVYGHIEATFDENGISIQ